MARIANPFDFLRPVIESTKMMIEAQQVIAWRMTGMAGLWPMGQAEQQRMVDEKVAAVRESTKAAMRVGMAGGSASAVTLAAVKPLRRRTQANVKRLSAKATGGPGFGGQG